MRHSLRLLDLPAPAPARLEAHTDAEALDIERALSAESASASAKNRVRQADAGRAALRVDGPKLEGWYIAKTVLRIISFLFATSLLGITLTHYASGTFDNMFPWYSEFPILEIVLYIFTGGVMLWDLSEFITMACRRGYGITPKAHVGVDLTLALLGLTATAAVVVFSNFVFTRWRRRVSNQVSNAALALAVLLSVIHFILFVRNAKDRFRGKGLTPRIMYLSNGEPVVVLPRPFPPPRTQEPDHEMVASPASTVAKPLNRGHSIDSPVTRTITAVEEDIPTPESPAQLPTLPLPRRKPVPTRGTPFADPWANPGPDYEPDASERQRARRGESQAQWISLRGVAVGTESKAILPAEPSQQNTGSRQAVKG